MRCWALLLSVRAARGLGGLAQHCTNFTRARSGRALGLAALVQHGQLGTAGWGRADPLTKSTGSGIAQARFFRAGLGMPAQIYTPTQSPLHK